MPNNAMRRRQRADLIADWTEHWHRRGTSLARPQRQHVLTMLAGASPMLRTWRQWDRLFEPLFLLAVGGQSAGVLAMALNASPILSGGLVLAGETTTAVLAVRLRQAMRQALDITAGRLVGPVP